MKRINPPWSAKLSGAAALLLAVSMALPILAFAQSYIYKVTYDKSTGTVTASVYTDETVTGNVYLDIRDELSSVIGSVYLGERSGTYTVGDSVYDRYDFTYTVTQDVYERLKLQSWYVNADEKTVTSDVYSVEAAPQTPPGNNNGGGGYVPTFPTTPPAGAGDGTVQAGADGSVPAEELKKELAAHDVVTLKLSGEAALLPASVLMEATRKNRILFENDTATLDLPLSVLKLQAIAASLETPANDLKLRIEIAKLDGEALDAVEGAAGKADATLRSAPVSYALTAIGDGGRTLEIDDFGGVYVSRTLPVETGASPSLLVGATYDPGTGTFAFVPTDLAFDEVSGAVEAAVLKRTGNSVYVVLERSKSFGDLDGHWAEEDVEKMAGKLIVEGVAANAFAPDRSITRAEFATLLIRSLGLAANENGSAPFHDVRASDWFADAVATAAEAELVNGDPDGSFRPNDNVTRAEMSAMIVRAKAYATGTTPQMTITPGQVDAALAGYADRHLLAWSKTDMAIAVRDGVVQGLTETSLAPNAPATRAQAAVMLKRWLTNIDFLP